MIAAPHTPYVSTGLIMTRHRSPKKNLLGSRSAMAVPKSKNLYSLSVGAHTVVEVIVNATKVNASDRGEPSVGDKRPE